MGYKDRPSICNTKEPAHWTFWILSFYKLVTVQDNLKNAMLLHKKCPLSTAGK